MMVGIADLKLRGNFVKAVLSSRNYFALFLFLFATYTGVNFWLNMFYEALPSFLNFRLSVAVPYLAGTVLIGLLVALNLTIIAYKLRQVLAVGKEVGVTAVGMFGGMLGGACPGCFVGVFPAVAGLFGVTATLGSLPFLGFEILVPTLLIVLVSLYVVAKPLTCAPDNAKKKNK